MQTEAPLTNAPAAAPMRAPMTMLSTVSVRRVPTAILVVYALLLALGLGLGTAYWVINGNPPFGSLRLGPWQSWPKLGSPEADPYMRAILAHRGDVPLATGEGLGFLRDGQRRPAARFRLHLYHRHDRTRRAPLDRHPL